MKIIYNKYLPTKGFKAINLFGVIFVRSDAGVLTRIDANHESIHTVQARELLFIFFYIWYLTEWLVRLAQYRNTLTAYFNISFEREAYANEKNLDYIKNRTFFSFRKYLKKK